jgi:hypothetical protein
MTARKPIEPVKCVCGKRAYVTDYSAGFFVGCDDSKCWIGPNRSTERGAVLAWNRAMGAFPRRRRHA